MASVQEGYEFAIKDPKASADILLKEAPELKESKELVYKSQEYLKDKYQDDAKEWGVQDKKVWENFAQFMKENKIIKKISMLKKHLPMNLWRGTNG